MLALVTFVSVASPAFSQNSASAQKSAPSKPAAATAKAAPVASGEPMDINTASEAQLKTLPGIGDAYSKRIVAGRPYAAKNQLVSKGIVPQATYDKVQTLIIAKRPGK